jgi:hypothetical protein
MRPVTTTNRTKSHGVGTRQVDVLGGRGCGWGGSWRSSAVVDLMAREGDGVVENGLPLELGRHGVEGLEEEGHVEVRVARHLVGKWAAGPVARVPGPLGLDHLLELVLGAIGVASQHRVEPHLRLLAQRQHRMAHWAQECNVQVRLISQIIEIIRVF